MKYRVPNPVVAFAMNVLFALAACSGDDAPGSSQATPPVESAPVTQQVDSTAPAEAAIPAAPVAATAAPEVPPAPVVEPQPTITDAATDVVDAAPTSAPTQHILKGVVTQWAPLVLFVKPGDQIVFRQMAGHDSETIEGMIPEGAETWKSTMGQEGFAVSPAVPGIYMYKCNPHVSLGMIGAIAVGDPPYANLDAIEAHPPNKGMIGRAIRNLKQAMARKEDGGDTAL